MQDLRLQPEDFIEIRFDFQTPLSFREELERIVLEHLLQGFSTNMSYTLDGASLHGVIRISGDQAIEKSGFGQKFDVIEYLRKSRAEFDDIFAHTAEALRTHVSVGGLSEIFISYDFHSSSEQVKAFIDFHAMRKILTFELPHTSGFFAKKHMRLWKSVALKSINAALGAMLVSSLVACGSAPKDQSQGSPAVSSSVTRSSAATPASNGGFVTPASNGGKSHVMATLAQQGVSIKNPSFPSSSQQSINDHLIDFEEMAKSYNLEFPQVRILVADHIGITNSASKDTKDQYARGVCDIVTRTIYIDASRYVQLSPIEQKALVYHEAGHCALNSVHDTDVYDEDLMNAHSVDMVRSAHMTEDQLDDLVTRYFERVAAGDN